MTLEVGGCEGRSASIWWPPKTDFLPGHAWPPRGQLTVQGIMNSGCRCSLQQQQQRLEHHGALECTPVHERSAGSMWYEVQRVWYALHLAQAQVMVTHADTALHCL